MKNYLYKAMRILFTLPLLFACTVYFAQRSKGNDEALAMQYLEARDYDKALVYLEDLYERQPEAWFSPYLKSLIATKDFSRAEKICRKQLKRNPHSPSLFVHLGHVYKLQGEEKKEKEQYEKALKELNPINPEVQSLATAFLEYGLYDQALSVYLKGRNAYPDYPYFYERADIMKSANDLQGMINEYLDALEYRETDIENVKRNLQNSLGYDDEEGGFRNPVLKTELQKRIQKHPEKTVFVDFLIFVLMQQKDFEAAFVHERSLDKRLKRDGYKIYELARTCVSNANFETARRCYEYLLEKGPNSTYYDLAVIDGLTTDYLLISQNPSPTQEQMILLEDKLQKAHDKYRNYGSDSSIVRSLAGLRAYFMNKPAEAIAVLEEYIGQPGINNQVKAQYKLMLADIYLVKGEIWDASLLYSQVEKSFRHEAIGYEAKFRNARLSYFAGDFPWAKTQADVLKGATSKLTANDALDLSLVIGDAIGVDTNDAPLKMFSGAELLMMQRRYSEAIARMDSINLVFSTHTLGDDINFKKAQIYASQGKYAEAEKMYRDILEYYPTQIYGDDAQFRLAELYEKRLNDKEKAMQAYEDVLTKYPGSIYTVESRKRYRSLRGDVLKN
jgi:tetratricopeptide (TPR) repeat protein